MGGGGLRVGVWGSGLCGIEFRKFSGKWLGFGGLLGVWVELLGVRVWSKAGRVTGFCPRHQGKLQKEQLSMAMVQQSTAWWSIV